jgi:hypothetical protein
MKLPLLIAVLLLSSFSWAKDRAYLDLEDGDHVSIFSAPGYNYESCAEQGDPYLCKSVAWPDNKSELYRVDDKVVKKLVPDIHGGLPSLEEFVQVSYSYKRRGKDGKTVKQTGTGWIELAYLRDKEVKPFFGEDVEGKVCDPKKPKGGPFASPGMSTLHEAIQQKNVNSIADALGPLTGQCALGDLKADKSKKVPNTYDKYILGKVTRQKLPKILKEDNTAMTKSDLVDVDALARTLYGEMAGCFKHGLQYPMGVARVALNRSLDGSHARLFIQPPHNPNKGALAKVVTTPSQFSVWQKSFSGAPNGSLKLALCPPSQKDKASWQGHKPSEEEAEIWQNALRIATETVLFPTSKFKPRTSQMNDLYYYTSGMSSFYKMKQVFPWIGDRRINRDSCLQIWQEKKS